MATQDNRQSEPLGDGFWAAVTGELRKHNTRLENSNGKSHSVQSQTIPDAAIKEWHRTQTQEQTCQMAESGNTDAIRHVHQCIDCKTHYRATRGRDFDQR